MEDKSTEAGFYLYFLPVVNIGSLLDSVGSFNLQVSQKKPPVRHMQAWTQAVNILQRFQFLFDG